MARESGSRRRKPNRSLAIRQACAAAALASVVSISAPEAHGPAVSGPVPRFIDDADRSLLVFEERAGTSRQEALRVVLESDPVSGRRRIRVGGLLALAATLAIECDARTWSLPLAHAPGSGAGAVGVYAVTDPVAASCMASTTCRLLGLEDEVAVPVDRLRV